MALFIFLAIASPCYAYAEPLTSDNVSRAESDSKIEGLRRDIATLQQSVDNLTAAGDASKQAARIAFEKAQVFVSESKMREAGFYFAVAASSDPSDGTYIKGYTDAVLNWADAAIKSGKPEKAVQPLYDMESFLLSYATSVVGANADTVFRCVSDISAKLENVLSASQMKSAGDDSENMSAALREASILLAAGLPDGAAAVEEYKTRAESISAGIIKFSEGRVTDNTRVLLDKLADSIRSAAIVLEIEKYLLRGSELLTSAQSQAGTAVSLQLLAEATLTGQKLSIAAEDVSPLLRKRISQFNDNLMKISAEIAKKISVQQYEKLRNKYDSLLKRLSKNETNAERAQVLLFELQDDIIVESIKITDPEYMKGMRKLISQISGEIEKWREIQQKRYEGWAVKTLKRFHETYKGEMGLLGSGNDTKERIAIGMKDYLCPIDVKYLGPSAMMVYTDVFELFYKELSRDQRIKLSSDFVNCEKRHIKEF